ncbi:MAG: hypothetical protein HYX66_06880 [Ignavibacteria bacterium]|nr:hypothetical protein [Ignavibacteria bacterium]
MKPIIKTFRTAICACVLASIGVVAFSQPKPMPIPVKNQEGSMVTGKAPAAPQPVVIPPAQAVPQGQTIGTVVTLTGYMLNQNTLTPVDANYAVYEAGKKVGQSRKSSVRDGFLVTGLKPGGSYTVMIEDPRYFREEFPIALPQSSRYAEISKDFIVRPMEAGKKIVIMPSPFDLRKNVIKAGVEEDLVHFAKMLSMNPGVSVELVCYPDEEVPAAAASSISTTRGNALKAEFEKAGISGSRISVKSASTVDPINPPPIKKSAKGKRYVGTVYVVVTKT